MNGLGSPDQSEISPFRRYYMIMVGLRKKPDSGAEKALRVAGVHESWTTEALDSNPQKYSWVNLVDVATQLATDPDTNTDLKNKLIEELNQLEAFADLKKPTIAEENKGHLRRLFQLVRQGKQS